MNKYNTKTIQHCFQAKIYDAKTTRDTFKPMLGLLAKEKETYFEQTLGNLLISKEGRDFKTHRCKDTIEKHISVHI